MPEAQNKSMSDTIKSEEASNSFILGKPKDESSSLLMNSVPAEIHGAGPGVNAGETAGSATLQHSFLTRVLHQPGSEHAPDSSIGSRDIRSSTSLHGRNIELVKLEDNEVAEDGSWMHQSRMGGKGTNFPDESYDDDFEMSDGSLSLSATAGTLTNAAQPRRHTAQSKRKTVKDATPIKEEAHEEDSDESAGKRAINMQRVPSRERGNTARLSQRASSRGESLDRDSGGQAEISRDMRGIEDQFIQRSKQASAKDAEQSNTHSVPIEESSKSASGAHASVEKVRNVNGADKGVVIEAIEEDDDYSANFEEKSSMTASA